MNMNQLKYVLTVANSSSLREAAMKLYISQPALSLSISELENELGIVLFERSNRGIGLTDAGREFITYAKKVLGQYEILEDRYLSRNKNKERFSVSTQHYNFAIRSFTNVIRRFGPDKYVFSIHETKTNEVLENVRDMKSEVGCGMLSSEDAILQGFVSIKLKEEDPLTIGYITRKGSSLSRYGEAYIEELLKYRETM